MAQKPKISDSTLSPTAQSLDIDRQYDALMFSVQRSILYHQRMRRYYERRNTFAAASMLVYGTTGFVAVLGNLLTGEGAAIAIAIVSVIIIRDLVAQTSRRAWEHADLARRFGDLEISMIGGSASSLSSDEMKTFQSRRREIEKDEPPIRRALDLVCHNELVLSKDISEQRKLEHTYKLPFYMKWTAAWFDWNTNNVRSYADIEKSKER